MYVLVVSDLHGHVWEPFLWALRLEEQLGCRISAILCCGDLGYFPDAARLDGPTLRHAQQDPGELEFTYCFAQRVPEVVEWLDTLDQPPPPMYFVRGNHEDHEVLSSLQSEAAPVAVDAYSLIWFLPDAVPLRLCGEDGAALTVLGLGGVEHLSPRRHHPYAFVQETAIEKLLGLRRGAADVLLTHAVPEEVEKGLTVPGAVRPEQAWRYNPRRASGLVSMAVQWLQPAYHFFGHLHFPVGPFEAGATRCVGIAATSQFLATRAGSCDGVLGLLEWDRQGHGTFHFVADTWLEEWKQRGRAGLGHPGPSARSRGLGRSCPRSQRQ
ncbi:MAG: metallophosphoesterase family protein [Armatimonadetes bacterium]|nr:metallophosphoesterase family protein [Armatimonadota bacterium]